MEDWRVEDNTLLFFQSSIQEPDCTLQSKNRSKGVHYKNANREAKNRGVNRRRNVVNIWHTRYGLRTGAKQPT